MLSNLKHIVIADDDEDDIAIFKDAIEKICPTLEVLTAENGVKLLSLLNEIPKPDAILLDLNMPLKSGKQCLEEIRAKCDFNVVPIVILSTSSLQQDMEYCLKKGANHYFIKPQCFDGMRTIVTKIWSGLLTKEM